ncbi:hypothetical protein KAU45_07580 [bacterium]|nr:hypothetical protein [bacterium]
MQYGFSAMFDAYLFEGFAVGPYVGGMFRVDKSTYEDEVFDIKQESEITTNELMYGIGISYGFNPGGINPWLRIAACYTDFTNSGRNEFTYHGDTYVHEYNSEGEGFALDAALGVDFPLGEIIYIGVGVDYHYSNVRKVIWDDLDEEHAEQEWNESPQALGGIVSVGFLF